MAEVTQEMLRAALNELEVRIMGNVSAAVQASEARVAESLQGTVAQSAAFHARLCGRCRHEGTGRPEAGHAHSS